MASSRNGKSFAINHSSVKVVSNGTSFSSAPAATLRKETSGLANNNNDKKKAPVNNNRIRSKDSKDQSCRLLSLRLSESLTTSKLKSYKEPWMSSSKLSKVQSSSVGRLGLSDNLTAPKVLKSTKKARMSLDGCLLPNTTKKRNVRKSYSIQNDLRPRHYSSQQLECDSMASTNSTTDLKELHLEKRRNEIGCPNFQEEAIKVADQLAAAVRSDDEKNAAKTSIIRPSVMLVRLEEELGCEASVDGIAFDGQKPLYWPLSPVFHYHDDNNNIQNLPCKGDSEENLRHEDEGIKYKEATGQNLIANDIFQTQAGKQSSSEGKLSTLVVGSLRYIMSNIFLRPFSETATSEGSAIPVFGYPRRGILKSILKLGGQSQKQNGLRIKIHSPKVSWGDTTVIPIGKGIDVVSPVSGRSGSWCNDNGGDGSGISDNKNENCFALTSLVDQLFDRMDKAQDGDLRSFSRGDTCRELCNHAIRRARHWICTCKHEGLMLKSRALLVWRSLWDRKGLRVDWASLQQDLVPKSTSQCKCRWVRGGHELSST